MRRATAVPGAGIAAGAVIVGIVGISLALGWSGTSPADPPRELGYDEALTLWSQLREPEWEAIQTLYPGVARPDTTVVQVVASDEFPDLFAECVATEAFDGFPVVAPSGGGRVVTVAPEPSRIAVAEFACAGRYPESASIESLLSRDQAGALYDYYREFLEPCLIAQGEYPIPDPITRDEFVTSSVRDAVWSPFWTSLSRPDPDTLTPSVVERCPPEPAWFRAQRPAVG